METNEKKHVVNITLVHGYVGHLDYPCKMSFSFEMPHRQYKGNSEEVRQQYIADVKKHLTKLLEYL